MNSKTTAIVASVLIIALASSAIIGVTYSWFSDEDKVGISFTPGKVDIATSVSEMKVNEISDANNDNSITHDTTKVQLTNSENGCVINFDNVQPGDVLEFKLTITNNSTIKAKWAAIADDYNSKIYNIGITCGSIDCSKYTNFSSETVDVYVKISINTSVEFISSEDCKLTITAYATQSTNTAISPSTA